MKYGNGAQNSVATHGVAPKDSVATLHKKNSLCGRWTVPRLCMTYPRLSPGGDQMVARPSSDCRRTDAGLSLHCAGYLLGYPWATIGAAPWQPRGSYMAALTRPMGRKTHPMARKTCPMGHTNPSNGAHKLVQWRTQTLPMARTSSSNAQLQLMVWRPELS